MNVQSKIKSNKVLLCAHPNTIHKWCLNVASYFKKSMILTKFSHSWKHSNTSELKKESPKISKHKFSLSYMKTHNSTMKSLKF